MDVSSVASAWTWAMDEDEAASEFRRSCDEHTVATTQHRTEALLRSLLLPMMMVMLFGAYKPMWYMLLSLSYSYSNTRHPPDAPAPLPGPSKSHHPGEMMQTAGGHEVPQYSLEMIQNATCHCVHLPCALAASCSGPCAAMLLMSGLLTNAC